MDTFLKQFWIHVQVIKSFGIAVLMMASSISSLKFDELLLYTFFLQLRYFPPSSDFVFFYSSFANHTSDINEIKLNHDKLINNVPFNKKY